VEFQNNQMEALLKTSTKFGEKSGSRHFPVVKLFSAFLVSALKS
jgi:hypothetical protein